jgi:hypothetical protein
MVVPTTMDVDAIRKCKSLCRASMICIKAGQPANIAWDRSIFDFLPAPSDFNEPGVSSSASGSNPKASEKPASTGSNLSQVSISPASNRLPRSIFDFQAPPLYLNASSSPASGSNSFTASNRPPYSEFLIFRLLTDLPIPPPLSHSDKSSSPASGLNLCAADSASNRPALSVFDFQAPPPSSLDPSVFDFQPSISVTNPASPSPLAQPTLASPFGNRQSHKSSTGGTGRVVIVPTAPGQALAFLPAPILIHTQDRSTPRPPRSTELLDLDPNSPRARGLLRKQNLVVRWEDADTDPRIGNVAKAFTKVWERAYDPDASPDPVVRTLQDAIDKMYTEPDNLTEDMDSDYGHIHRETLKCLPEKITTTSHYRYVLATLRRDKERLHEQIETDRDMVAAMDSTLEALRPFVVDKGKGRDRG